LQDAARELFARNGFEHTSVQQIAEAADVSERTFFRYFRAKDDLLLPDLAGFFEAVAGALSERPATEAPLAAIHASTLTALMSPGAVIASIPGPPWSTPWIDRHLVKAFTAFEDRLAEVLVQRAQTTAPRLELSEVRLYADVTARVAVSAVRASMITARARVSQGLATKDDVPLLLARAFAVAEAGCPRPMP
jgi:AcrR family transcriptional regulator